MRFRIFVLAAALACIASSRPLGARDADAELRAFVAAQNKFALAMYWQMTRDQDRVALSPFSLSSLMAMTLEGARGKTADEIERVFAVPRDGGARRSLFAALQPAAGAANAVFTQKDGPFKASYGDALSRYYGAARTEVDFPYAIWFAKRSVDSWIDSVTGNRIPRVDERGGARLTRLEGPPDALVAGHIPDMWAGSSGIVDIGVHPSLGLYASRTTAIVTLKEGATVGQVNRALADAGVEVIGGMPVFEMLVIQVEDDGTFGPLDRAMVKLEKDPAVDNVSLSPIMGPDIDGQPPISDSLGRIVWANASSMAGAWTRDVKHQPTGRADIIHRTTQDGRIALTLLISRTGTFFDADRELTAAKVALWHRPGAWSSNVPIPEMPAFSLTSRAPLRATLERMGVEKLFEESTEDFSGIDAEQPSPMQSAAHHATFTLSASGFEAAAATTAGSAVLEIEPRATGAAAPCTCVFLLQDAKTGLILFMGRMR